MEYIDAERKTRATDYSGEEPMSTVVALELAATMGKSPTESPPLAEAVDTDALDQLFRNSDAEVELTFSHADRRVVVSEGGVTVERIR